MLPTEPPVIGLLADGYMSVGCFESYIVTCNQAAQKIVRLSYTQLCLTSIFNSIPQNWEYAIYNETNLSFTYL